MEKNTLKVVAAGAALAAGVVVGAPATAEAAPAQGRISTAQLHEHLKAAVAAETRAAALSGSAVYIGQVTGSGI